MKKLHLRKMTNTLQDGHAQYYLDRERSIDLNALVGKKLSLRFTGEINCINCTRSIKKTFNQGYCFPCFQTLARCDSCVVKPELCHYHKGTCREEDWGEEHCFIPHTIYLANSSGLKVGITRGETPFTRWMDQGATQGIVLGHTDSRLQAGLIEVSLKEYFADKTNWRKMLSSEAEPIDLASERERLLAIDGEWLEDCEPASTDPVNISYPIEKYPEKVKSLNFDKQAEVGGTLQGIKGQYLIFGSGVINIRKFAGYEVEIKT